MTRFEFYAHIDALPFKAEARENIAAMAMDNAPDEDAADGWGVDWEKAFSTMVMIADTPTDYGIEV